MHEEEEEEEKEEVTPLTKYPSTGQLSLLDAAKTEVSIKARTPLVCDHRNGAFLCYPHFSHDITSVLSPTLLIK